MKLLVFGTGLFFKNRKEELNSIIYKKAEIIAFLDNNPKEVPECGTKTIYHPNNALSIDFDMVVLMSLKAEEMKQQLLDIGVSKEKIYTWDKFKNKMLCGCLQFYCASTKKNPKENILVLSTDLNYNGGTIAAAYAVKALQNRGYNVCLAAPDGDIRYIKECVAQGINVMICPGIYEFGNEEQFWISQFDVVLVNVFQMMECAVKISKIKPVLWWIHEAKDFYAPIIEKYSDYAKVEMFRKLNVRAVSQIPKKNFNCFFPKKITDTLSYGIPDEISLVREGKIQNKVVFAIVGSVCERKAQDIYIKAIKQLTNQQKAKSEFWLIGEIGSDQYSEYVRELSEQEESVFLKGLYSREEMKLVYQDIDVVVCPSVEDPLPIVMTEAMMNERPCIVSDNTGTAEYISDGENGFVVKQGDVEDLANKLQWFIENPDKIKMMGKHARKIYEKHFTLEIFGENLELALKETIQKYGEEHEECKS